MNRCPSEIVLAVHKSRLGIAEVLMVVHRAGVELQSTSALKDPAIAP